MSRDKDRLQGPEEEPSSDGSFRTRRPSQRSRPPKYSREHSSETNPRPRRPPQRPQGSQQGPRSPRNTRDEYYRTDSRSRRPRPSEDTLDDYETDLRPRGSRQDPPRSPRDTRDYYDEPDLRPRQRTRLPEDYDVVDRPRTRTAGRPGEDYYVTDQPPTRQRPRTAQRPPVTRPLPQAKRRSAWSLLFLGCAGGILLVGLTAVIIILATTHSLPVSNLGGVLHQATYTQQSQVPVPVPNLTQMQVHNQVGNVTIMVDPNSTATSPLLTTIKKVSASSQDAANKEFNNIAVQVQPPGTANGTLSVNATIPGQSGGILATTNDSVDLTITLPPSVAYSNPNAPLTANVTTPVGNVTLDGLSGVLSIKDDRGNVTVHHAILADGSHLQAGIGNVTFDGALNTANTSNPTPRFKIQSEIGKLDVTLPATTNATLDANVNAGKINSDFGINVQNTSGGANYFGPLISTNAANPPAVLTLDVSTGDINLHKA